MIDLSKLTPGREGHSELVVGEQHTAPRIGSGRVRVLATPVMINLMEAAALDAVENLIPAGHQKSRHPPRRPPHRGDPRRHACSRDG